MPEGVESVPAVWRPGHNEGEGCFERRSGGRADNVCGVSPLIGAADIENQRGRQRAGHNARNRGGHARPGLASRLGKGRI